MIGKAKKERAGKVKNRPMSDTPYDVDKGEKIRGTTLRRVAKIVLWVALLFIFARGVMSILSGVSIADMRKDIDSYMTELEQREETAAGAKAFAENFVRDYYTFTGRGNSDYTERISKYIASGVLIKEPTGGVAASAKNCRALAADVAGANLFDVTVTASVSYTSAALTTGEAVNTSKELTLVVPVASKDGRFAVDELPQLIPSQDKADVSKASGYSGTEIDNEEKGAIKDVVENFLRAYYSGNKSEISYYVVPDFPYEHGLEGLVTFDKLTGIKVYYDVVGEEYIIDADLRVNDSGQILDQHLYLTAGKEKDERYYIKSIGTRIFQSEQSK